MGWKLDSFPATLGAENWHHAADSSGITHYVVLHGRHAGSPVAVRILASDLAVLSEGNLNLAGHSGPNPPYDGAKVAAVLCRFESPIRAWAERQELPSGAVLLPLDELRREVESHQSR